MRGYWLKAVVLLVAAAVPLVFAAPAHADNFPLHLASRLVVPYFTSNATSDTLIFLNAGFAGSLPQNLDIRFHNPACSVNTDRNASLGSATADRGSGTFLVGAFGTGITQGWMDIQQSGGAIPNRLTGEGMIVYFDLDLAIHFNLVPLPSGNQTLLPTDAVSGPVLAVSPPQITGTLILVSVGTFAANGGGPQTVNFRVNDAQGNFTTGSVGPFNCQLIQAIDTIFPNTTRALQPAPPAGQFFYPTFRIQTLSSAPIIMYYQEIFDDGAGHRFGDMREFWQ
jgi:hypothetical protein